MRSGNPLETGRETCGQQLCAGIIRHVHIQKAFLHRSRKRTAAKGLDAVHKIDYQRGNPRAHNVAAVLGIPRVPLDANGRDPAPPAEFGNVRPDHAVIR